MLSRCHEIQFSNLLNRSTKTCALKGRPQVWAGTTNSFSVSLKKKKLHLDPLGEKWKAARKSVLHNPAQQPVEGQLINRVLIEPTFYPHSKSKGVTDVASTNKVNKYIQEIELCRQKGLSQVMKKKVCLKVKGLNRSFDLNSKLCHSRSPQLVQGNLSFFGIEKTPSPIYLKTKSFD